MPSGFGSFSNGGLGMGVAFTLKDYFTDSSRQIQSSMTSLESTTDALQRKINVSLAMVGAGVGAAAIGVGSLAIFQKASDIRATFQGYETQFQTLLGSASRASAFFEKIKQDASDNPIFGTESLTAANAALVSTGNVAEEQSRRIVNNLSEILAGVGAGDAQLKGMAVNLQQIGNNGKASGMDIRQFGMAGVPIMKLLQESTGKTSEELMKQGVTLDLLDKAFYKATSSTGMFYRATERAAESTNGLKAAVQDSIQLSWEALGKAIEPITRNIYKWVGGVLNKLKEFLNTPLGQKIAQWTFYVSAFLAVGGLLLILIGGTRIALMKLAWAFGASTKAKIIETIATQGLTAGLREMAVAAWASLGPYLIIVAVLAALIYIGYKAWDMISNGSETVAKFGVILMGVLGPIGMVIGLIAGIRRGFEELKKPMDEMPTTGVLGFFTKLAAIIQMVREVWASWNGETATFSQELRERLQHLGVLEIAEKIASYAVRVKQFFMGVWEGMKPAMDALRELGAYLQDRFGGVLDQLIESVTRIWGTFKEAFKPVADLLQLVWDKLFGVNSSLSTWAILGKAAGFAISEIFKFIAFVLEFVIWLITEIIRGVILVVEGIVRAFIWMAGLITSIWTSIGEFIFKWFDKLMNLSDRMRAAGIRFVNAFWEGIKSLWGALSDWVGDRISALVHKIIDPIKHAFNFIKTGGGLWGNPDDEDNPTGSDTGGTPTGSPLPRTMFHLPNTTKNPIVVNNQPLATQVAQQSQPITIPIYMDGDKIAEKVIDKQDLHNARKND